MTGHFPLLSAGDLLIALIDDGVRQRRRRRDAARSDWSGGSKRCLDLSFAAKLSSSNLFGCQILPAARGPVAFRSWLTRARFSSSSLARCCFLLSPLTSLIAGHLPPAMVATNPNAVFPAHETTSSFSFPKEEEKVSRLSSISSKTSAPAAVSSSTPPVSTHDQRISTVQQLTRNHSPFIAAGPCILEGD